MNCRAGIMCVAMALSAYVLPGQQGDSEATANPGGISLRAGAGSFFMTDQYISPERYEGFLPYFALGWERSHLRYCYFLTFEFGQSDRINNYNVTSEVLNARLSQGFLYPLRPARVLGRDLAFRIGPVTDFYFFSNRPDIAVSGFDYTNSFVNLFSVGFRGDGKYAVSHGLSVLASLHLNLLSLGVRSVDSEEEDDSATKLVSFASGLNTTFELGIGYVPVPWLSGNLSYRFELTRVTAWEDLLFVSNGGFLELKFRF